MKNDKVFLGICMAVLIVLLAWIVAGRLAAPAPVTEEKGQEAAQEVPGAYPSVKVLSAVVYEAAPQIVKTAPEAADSFTAAETYTAPTTPAADSGGAGNRAGVIAKGNSGLEAAANPVTAEETSGEALKPSERSREPFSPPVDYMSQKHDSSGGSRSGMRLLGTYSVTGYDVCVECCGKTDGVTASGARAAVGRTCASNDFPFGTVLYIEGIGYRTVEDRGGMGRGVIDVLCGNHGECAAITGRYTVYVCE